jgi:hypothetical protein
MTGFLCWGREREEAQSKMKVNVYRDVVSRDVFYRPFVMVSMVDRCEIGQTSILDIGAMYNRFLPCMTTSHI